MPIKAIGSTRVANVNDGAQGIQGEQGVSVVLVTPQYYLSTSNSSLVGGSWVTTRPAITTGTYLWTRERTDLSNNTSVYSDPVYDSTITDLVFDVDSLNNEISTKVSSSDFHTMITQDSTIQEISTTASTANQTANGLTTRVSSVESTLTTKADGSTVTALQTTVSEVSQKADRIDLVLTSNSTAASVSLTPEALAAIASYINLNGVVQFSGLSNAAIQSLTSGSLIVYYDSQCNVITDESENVLTDENDQVIADDIVRLIFADENGGDGWVFFQNQKVIVPTFTVDIYLDQFPQISGLIVYRQSNQTPYVVWKTTDSLNAVSWHSMNIQNDTTVYDWTWQSATDVILCEWTKDTLAHVSHECFYPAKCREDLRTFDFLTNIAYQNAITDATTINGGLIETNTIIADKLYVQTLSSITANIGELTSGVIRSANYSYSSGTYSSTGLKIDFDNATFTSPNFAIDASGNTYVKGNITATSGTFSGSITVSGTMTGGTYIGSSIRSSNYSYSSGTYSSAGMIVDLANSVIRTPYFAVSGGKLYTTEATISGAIAATTGTIGGVTIHSSYGMYTNSKTSATSTNTGFLIANSGAIYVGAYNSTNSACPFQVTAAGALTATNATINGTITTSNLTANGGTIGGITIHNSYGMYTNSKTTATSTNTGFLISKSGAIYVGAYNSTNSACPFQVTAAGALTATNATINGTITTNSLTATAGTIGGITLNSSYGIYTNSKTTATSTNTGFLISKSGAIYIGAYSSTTGACPFQITSAGALICTSGTIGGWTIGTSAIYHGTTGLSSSTNGTYIGTDGIMDKWGSYFVQISQGYITAYAMQVDLRGNIIVGVNAYTPNWGQSYDFADSYAEVAPGGFLVRKGSDNSLLLEMDTLVSGTTYYGRIYCKGNITATGTITDGSDERLKNILGWDKTVHDFVMNLNPIMFTWKEGADEKVHYGLGAQTTNALLEKYGMNDRGFVCYDQEKDLYSIAYMELAPMMLPTLQKTYRKTEELERRIAELEAEIKLLKG